MRFRSLLRPYHGLAWHCSTARRGPLSPLIGDLYIEELATTFNISTVFTPDLQLSSYRGDHHFSHFIIVFISLHSPHESKPKKWLFSLLWMQKLYWDWGLELREVPRWMQEWIPEGQFLPSFCQCFSFGPTQLLRKCFQYVCSADEEYPMLLMNCQKDGNWVGDKSYLQTKFKHTYLVWRLTMIKKVVPLGRGLSIAHWLGWPLRLPQMWLTRARNFC